jgi:hypothetical protein
MRFDIKTKASPEQVLRALTDFTDARLQAAHLGFAPDGGPARSAVVGALPPGRRADLRGNLHAALRRVGDYRG